MKRIARRIRGFHSSHPGRQPLKYGVYLSFFAAALIILLATASGYWLGSISWTTDRDETPTPVAQGESPEGPAPNVPPEEETPLYLFVNALPGSDQTAIAEEIALAKGAGIHRVVLAVPLTWETDAATADPAASKGAPELVQRFVEADSLLRVVLQVKLDPPESWLAAHPDAAVRVGDSAESQPCLASEVWRAAAMQALDGLARGIDDSPCSSHILGYVIACLEDGRWRRAGAYDRSAANVAGFRQWLLARYGNDAALRQAWGDDQVTIAGAGVPDEPDTANQREVFFEIPREQRQVDYLRYLSEMTAGAIATMAGHIKSVVGENSFVLAPYGYSFEMTSNRAGHSALGSLLESAVDGFVSPVSNVDRGVGGAGGFMGPINSALFHEKQWFIADDTRTGIARDPATGSIKRIAGLFPEDVYNVLKRNFAAALAQGLGLFWADVDGDGRFDDHEMWTRIQKMQEVYRTFWNRPRDASAGEFNPSQHTPLLVVVDEASRFYQRCDVKLNELLLIQARDCALRAGVPAQFCLLQDVLAGRAVSASVYLFLNAFRLTDEDCRRIHEVLARDGAGAIWMYAPGYFGDQPASAENITRVTQMTVKAFEGPASAGSVCVLSDDANSWVEANSPFGNADQWQPLFYIEDADANLVAEYRESKQPSVAMKFTEQGWTSVFLAEPTLTPGLLREILRLLDQHLYFRRSAVAFFDAAYFGPNLLAVHGREDGERTIEVSNYYNIHDLLEPDIGWPQTRSVRFPLKTGQTRVFELIPAEVPDETPAEPTG